NSRDQLVDLAWTLLVPRLLENGPTRADADVMAALARRTRAKTGGENESGRDTRLGQAALRADILESAHDALEALARKNRDFVPHLAAVARLSIDDLAADKEDVVPILVEQVGLAFDGRVPLVYADLLLEDFSQADSDGPPWWTRLQRQRLQVLLEQRAFAAGLEIGDLVDLARVCPNLGTVLAVDDPETLAQRRVLRSLRPSHPSQRVRPAP